MSFLNQKSFDTAVELSLPANVNARTSLLAQLDERMANYSVTERPTRTTCPEHLFGTDDAKMDAARFMAG